MNSAANVKTWILAGMVGTIAAVGWAASPIRWQGSPGWEPEGVYCRLYDSHTVVTVKGTVASVESVAPMEGMGPGIHLILKTDAETIPVQMGPADYVKKQPVQIGAHDVVEVTGSRVPCNGKQVILAAVIKKGNDTVKYRDLDGRPAWVARKQ